MEYRVDIVKMRELVEAIFKGSGLRKEDAWRVTDNLLFADMRGIHSHGLSKVATYVRWIKEGKIKISPEIKIINENACCTTFDADYAAGSVAGVYAMDYTIKKAKNQGLAMAVVKNGTHFGAAAYYALRAVKENMIGIALTNSVKLMAPFGGYDRELGTNPICVAVPGRKAVVYDGATSIAAYNKIMLANIEKKAIPENWALDNKGHCTTNPEEVVVHGGAVCPFGTYKGYGLATMVQILTGILSGGSLIVCDGELQENSDATAYNFMAIDISKFTDLEIFKKTVDIFGDRLKNSSKRDGVDEIYLPGEIEDLKYKESEEKGIELHANVISSIKDIAKSLGVSITADLYKE